MNNSVTDDFEAGSEPGLPVALLVILAGAAVLVAASVLVPQLVARPPFLTLILGGVALGALLWVVGMIAGARRSPLVWQIGALAILLAAGAAAGYGANRIYRAASAHDASSFAEAELATDGSPVLPRGASDRGPLSRAYVVAIAEATQDARDYQQALGALNLGVLNSPHLLAQAPEVLDRCGAIGRLHDRAEALNTRQRDRVAGLSRKVANSALATDLKRGVGLMVTAGGEDEALDAMLAQERARLESTEALCRLLAKRTWRNAMGYFAFSSGADTAAFDSITTRRHASASARAILDRATRDQWLEGQEVVRATLSK